MCAFEADGQAVLRGAQVSCKFTGSPLKGYIGNQIRQNPEPPPNQVKSLFLVLYGCMGRFDAWNVFVWTFENFKKTRSDNFFMKFSDLGFLDLFLDVWTCILGVRAFI